MRRWQKVIFAAVSGLTIILVAGVIAFHALTDSERLKAKAHERVQQSWSRDLQIGELSLHVFPYPHMRATRITLSNAAWAHDKDMLAADEVRGRFALFPLIRGEVVLTGLEFDGLKANLETGSQGQQNWVLGEGSRTLPNIALTELVVRDSTVSYRAYGDHPLVWQVNGLRADGAAGLRNVVFDLDLAREKHSLQLSGKLADLSQYGKPGAVSAGTVNIKSGPASATVSGRLPLGPALRDFDIDIIADAPSLQEFYGFMAIDRRSPVASRLQASVRSTAGKLVFEKLQLQMGKLTLNGSGRIDHMGENKIFDVKLRADRLDMTQTFLDAGQPPLPPKKAGQLFRDKPLPWTLLSQMAGVKGKADIAIASLRLRSGVEVSDVSADLAFDNDTMTAKSFGGKLLGGTASGDAVFRGTRKSAQVNLSMKQASLAQWLKQTGKQAKLDGGVMSVDAQISTSGDTLNEFASKLTGPVKIEVGPSKILSAKAGQAEYWLTGLFSAKDSERVELSCISARLPFVSGLAKGEAIAGARSDASQLLARGEVNLRNQTLDLRGRLRARSGISLGISNFAGDVKIAGDLLKPRLELDGAGAIGTIARIGAAILTGGVSILATAIWDGANPESDPCQVVFSSKAKAREMRELNNQ